VAEFIGETNFIPGTLKHFDARDMLIETPVGSLRALRQDTQGWEEGQSVWCSVRPEAWRVQRDSQREAQPEGDASTQDMNRLAARLEDVMYLGETEQLQLLLTGGTATTGPDETWRHIKTSVLNPGTAAPQPGENLTLACAPADVVVLAH
jgi:iron(III) transport system ATP-binding protein